MEKIRRAINMEDMEFNALFHIINDKATYNILLEWSWIYENSFVFLTLIQCFKYY